MIGIGKSSQHAIAAISFLAEKYDGGRTRHSAAEIASGRNLPRPCVAKLLTLLSQAGLVDGSPGPHGGYCLARSPPQITLYDIARIFEREYERLQCPYGSGWCGIKEPCPLHSELAALNDWMAEYLKRTTLEPFWRVHREPSSTG
jgi:Rrf2 family transcriptional regulator, iron-sulfur cluster assembly transcription factor